MENKGFTLMEVMVAMVLVSMVTLVAALGLRLSVRAFERVAKEGDSRQIITALPSLMERQLQWVKGTISFKKEDNTRLPFFSRKDGISFVTSFSPQGSQIHGLVRITYLFDREKHRLLVYEKAITRLKDLDETTDPLSEKWNQELTPVSILERIDDFMLVCQPQGKKKSSEQDDWEEEWKISASTLPGTIRMTMTVAGLDIPKQWLFEVGHE